MATLLMLASNVEPADVLPTLGLLGHRVTSLPLDPGALLDTPSVDCILVDARTDLLAARTTTRLLRTTGASAGVVVVVTEGGLAAVAPDWGVDDVVLTSAGPAEVELRIRLAAARAASADASAYEAQIRAGDLMIDESTYQARIGSEPLDLTFKEFELLKFLAMHPGRVFTRAQLLQEVWGYDYFGGTRTVDVHVRRLRAKLGPERESLIGTVRNVGYKFVEKPIDPFPPAPIAAATDDTVTEEVATEAAPLDTVPTTPV